MAAPAGASGSLKYTPTWALATVCFFFIALSIFIERLIHLVCGWLKRHRKTALFEAVERLKEVLMLLGFISLLLAVTSKFISKICIPTKVADTMIPCRHVASTKTTKSLGYEPHIWTARYQNSLSKTALFEDIPRQPERILATSASSDYCESKNMTSLISQEGINQLSIFIFVLAVMQVVYSVLTMALGRAKMKRWKAWEKETQTVEYRVAVDPNRFRFTRQTTFGRRHMSSCTETSLHVWIKCFFRQFFHSVAKVDYLTMRHGFISAHLPTNNSFNFQKYIQRSLEADFKVVVGISPLMWFILFIFLLLDVYGWHVYLGLSFLPLITVLVLGAKLEVIVARMALQLKQQNSVIQGAPTVQPNDNLFWFSHPKFVLTILHFTLFLNAFELAFFVWVTLQFGIDSCYHERTEIIIIRVVLAVTVQVICSYITLPLYALITQMGSKFKGAVVNDQTLNTIKKWHGEVRKNRGKKQESSLPGHGNSPNSRNSNSRISSPEPSTHNRAPTFAELTTPYHSQTDEIVQEYCQEIGQSKMSRT